MVWELYAGAGARVEDASAVGARSEAIESDNEKARAS